MEIRNLTQANSTSFGMSLRRPVEYMDRFVTAVGVDKGDFASKLRKRGLAQLQKELKDCKDYDVAYKVDDNGEDVFQVIMNSQEKVLEEVRKGDSGLVQPSFVTSGLKDDFDRLEKSPEKGLKALFQGVKIIGKSLVEGVKLFILNPKDSLPKTLLTAARDAKDLEKVSNKSLKTRVAHNNAINDVNNIFDR